MQMTKFWANSVCNFQSYALFWTSSILHSKVTLWAMFLENTLSCAHNFWHSIWNYVWGDLISVCFLFFFLLIYAPYATFIEPLEWSTLSTNLAKVMILGKGLGYVVLMTWLMFEEIPYLFVIIFKEIPCLIVQVVFPLSALVLWTYATLWTKFTSRSTGARFMIFGMHFGCDG